MKGIYFTFDSLLQKLLAKANNRNTLYKYGVNLILLVFSVFVSENIAAQACKPVAGADKTVNCLVSFPSGTATMTATNPSGGAVWSARAGNPGTATITTPSSNATTITNYSAAGVYGFVWTRNTGGGCTDTALVTVTAKPNAGIDATICQPTSTYTMGASGTGVWSLRASNPSTAVITTASSPTTTITALSTVGTYGFIWTSNGCADTVLLTVVAKPVAGADKAVSCVATFPSGSATMSATATTGGVWTPKAGNPGTASITSTTTAGTTITSYSAAGTYSFVWTNAGGCSDTADVVVTAKPNAGVDKTVCQPSLSTTMTASGTGVWTPRASNPSVALITNSTSPTTTITALITVGTYGFIWTANGCADTVEVFVVAKPVAGTDKIVSCLATFPGGSATMAATATTGGIWTPYASNPGTATITTSSSATTTITNFSTAGTYSFVWTNSAGCSDTADVVVTAKPSAGSNATICQPTTSYTMTASGTGIWTPKTGNPSIALISNSASPTTTITGLTTVGTYGFIWTGSNGCPDTVDIVVVAKPVAGADRTICKYSTATMGASGTGTWSPKAGNPATTSITTPTSTTTTITGFTVSGIYGFVWTNAGGCTDTTNVIVNPKPNAGFGGTICQATSTLTMTGVGTGTWTARVSPANPGTASITTPTSPTTTITGLTTAGTYGFVWTIASGCTDTADIVVVAKPSAGTDRTGICQNTSATMGATGTGTWSLLSTNPALATITTPTSNASTITGLTAAGTYGLIWTNTSGCTDTANVVVVSSPGAGTSGSVNVCSNNGATLNLANVIYGQQAGGTWTRLTGTGGTFTAGAGTFVPRKDSINTSTFQYAQAAAGSCPSSTSIATVITQDCDTSSKAVTDYLNWARLDFTPANPLINATSYTRTFKSLGNSFTLTASTLPTAGSRNIYAQSFIDATGYNALFMNNFNMTSVAGVLMCTVYSLMMV